MAVAVVHIVDVITMGHRDVSAILAVLMIMALMRSVFGRLALVVVTRVATVKVAVVHVVDMITVRNGDMTAVFTVHVVVAGMLDVSDCQKHPTTPRACHDSPFPVIACTPECRVPRWDVYPCTPRHLFPIS